MEMEFIRTRSPITWGANPVLPDVPVQIRSGISEVNVGNPGSYPCHIVFDPPFEELPVVKLTCLVEREGGWNALATISEITKSQCDFSVWVETNEDGGDGEINRPCYVQWFALEPTDLLQDNCFACNPYLYPASFFSDHGTALEAGTWPGIGISYEEGVPSIAPSTYALEATIRKCGDGLSFELGTIHDIGFNGEYDDGIEQHFFPEDDGSFNVFSNVESNAYIRIQIGLVTEPTHPNFGGLYAGAGIAGSIVVPGGGAQFYRVGSLRFWKGTSHADLETTTGLGGLADGADHVVRLEYYGGEDFSFFIDGIEFDDGFGIPISPAQLSTAQGYPGAETHASWDNPIILGWSYPMGADPDHSFPPSYRVNSAINRVQSTDGGWRLISTVEDTLEFKSL